MATSERMSGADGAWLQMGRRRNPMVVNVLVTTDGRVDPAELDDVLRARVVDAFPRFRQRAFPSPLALRSLEPGRWRYDDGFRLEEHLTRARLDPPGDDAALHRYVGDVAATHLDPRRALWQAHLIDGYAGGSALLLRTHHAMADGMALAHVVRSCTDGPSDRTPAPSRSRPRPNASTIVATTRADLASMRRLRGGLSAPTAVLGGVLDGAKTVAAAPVGLSAIKDAGRPVGATVNDVVLAGLAGALRRELERRGVALSDIEVAVPVDLRRGAVDDARLGNEFGLMAVRLPVSSDDADERLRRTKAEMDIVKASRDGELVLGALHVMGRTAPGLAKRWADAVSSRASAVVTNIPGPSGRRTLAGRPIDRITLWVPSSAQVGIGVSFFSYDGQVSVGVVADTAILGHASTLLGDLLDELRVLGVGSVPRPV